MLYFHWVFPLVICPPAPRTTGALVIRHWTMKTQLNILPESCCILKGLSGLLTASVVEILKLLQCFFSQPQQKVKLLDEILSSFYRQ